MASVDENVKTMLDRADETELCHSCAYWDLSHTFFMRDTLSNIRMASRSCDLHKLVYDACVRTLSVLGDGNTIHLYRSESNLFLEGVHSPLLSLCRSTGACPHHASSQQKILVQETSF